MNTQTKELLSEFRHINDMLQSYDKDATDQYIKDFKNAVLKVCDLMEQFNKDTDLFYNLYELQRLVGIYAQLDDYTDRTIISDIINRRLLNYYVDLNNFLK